MKSELQFLSECSVLSNCAGNIFPAVLPTSLNGMDEGTIEIVIFGTVNGSNAIVGS